MNKFLVISLFVVAAAVCVANTEELVREFYDLEKAEAVYEEHLKKFPREFKDEEEKKVRFEHFKETLKLINDHNSGDHSYTLGLNLFADMLPEERKHYTHGLLPMKDIEI